jgi:hypothetical protein
MGAAALASATVAVAIVVLIAVSDPLLCAAVAACVGVVGVRALRALLRAPLLLHVGADRKISVTARDGRTRHGVIHDDTSVGAWLTTIAWIPDGSPWYVPAETLVVLPDMLTADDFRRLRVYLRYGRAADGDTSEATAG